MRRLHWKPILAESLRDPAIRAIHDIATELVNGKQESFSTAELCDIALLCSYLEVAEPSSDWEGHAIELLNTAADRMSSDRARWPALFGGLVGCGWTFEHVFKMLGDASHESGQVVEGDDDPIADIDAFVLKCLRQRPWKATYDLISGLVGIGVYLLERLPRESAIEGIRFIVACLAEMSENSWGGTTWHTPPEFISKEQREQCPAGYYNLGVAHGVPGVVGFLGEVIAVGVEAPGCQHLLESAVQWVLAQQRSPNALSRYDSWFVPGLEPHDSRLGWCYGDLGLGAVLHHAASMVGRDDWRDFARGVLDHSLKRTAENGWIHDQGLCHGAVGVAHIHNRMYQITNDERYLESANAWYEHALRTREPGIGIAGFYAYRADRTPNRQTDISFLSGASGIALALISAMHPVEPAWDRLLLLSSRDRN